MGNFLGLITQGERYVWGFMRNYMPRWSIFLFDEIIVALSFVSLWLFRDSIAASPGEFFIFKFLLAVTLFSVTSMIFRTYHGVVRFSTMVDFKKLTTATIVASALYIACAIIITNTNIEGEKQMKFNILFPIVMGMMVIAGQFIFRFTVRSVFETLEYGTNSNNKTRAFILGSDYDSILLGNNLSTDRSSPYKPVAFIAFKSNQVGKVINGMPILSSAKGLTKHMEDYKVKTLLLYKAQLEAMPKEFYDRCIIEGLELLMVSSFIKYDENNGETSPQINKIKIEDLLGRNSIIMNKEKIEDQFEGQTILITGAAGSIGSEMARQISQFNCKELLLVDQAETPLNDLWLELIGAGIKFSIKPIIANITCQIKMRQIFEISRPSMVFHAAAYKHVPMMEFHPSTAVVTNVGGTKTIADLSVEYGVKRFVMISTDKAVNPTNVMGATKRAAEMYIQSLDSRQTGKENPTQFVTTRFGNVLGSSGSVVPLFKRQIEAGGPLTVTHKDITRYFMTIPEACSLVLEAGCTGIGGHIYIFDMGEAVKIYDLAEKMIRLSGKIPHKEIKIVETGLRPGEKLFEELLATAENTIPTYHKKVMIAKVQKCDYDAVAPEIKEMLYVSNKYVYPNDVVRLLKKLVPEFKSQNSEYEKLDHENDN